MLLAGTQPRATQTAPLCDPIVVVELVSQEESSKEPPIALNIKNNSTSTSNNDQRETNRLPILDYYLTFIHYFGFSINPNDDTSSRILSIRVKRAAAFASSFAKQRQQRNSHTSQEQCSSAQSDVLSGFDSATQQASAQSAGTRRRCSRWMPNGNSVKSGIKLVAISLTTFLAVNHVIVLIDYIYRGSKVLTELMLELRLVITKLSALIFVISWHRNQSEVRQLIRLIKSTSVNILMSEQTMTNHHQQPADEATPTTCDRLRMMNWRILKWWIFCTTITITHLSLSEAEIKSAQHLWEWLDDYSLHQLSNQTTSNATLFAMATFDNYIYTVHVYGTRLIGSSIICIVCTFQIENITCLTRQTLNLLQAYATPQTAPRPSTRSVTDQACAAGQVSRAATSWPSTWTGYAYLSPLLMNNDNVGVCDGSNSSQAASGNTSDLFCRALFYILGESDWNRVEQNRRCLAPIGRLSSPLARVWIGLSLRRLNLKQSLRRLCTSLDPSCELGQWLTTTLEGGRSLFAPNQVTPFWWLEGAETKRASSVAPNSATGGGGTHNLDSDRNSSSSRRSARDSCESGASATEAAGSSEPTPNRLVGQPGIDWRAPTIAATAALKQREEAPVPILRNYLDDYLARQRSVNGTQLYRHLGRCGMDDASQTRNNANLEDAASDGGRNYLATGTGQEIELHLENLARKYELIRTVNLRIDNCFGHMLLSQYSFLFLMSCIDVVFFSLSFNPNTKTKYIIVSGMILLWLPYLLVYKYASDVGLASKKLLTSVRRLARLAFVLQLSTSRHTGQRAGDTSSARLSPVNDSGSPFHEQHWQSEFLQQPPSMLTISGAGSARPWRQPRQRLRRRRRQRRSVDHLTPQTINGDSYHHHNPIMSASESRARIFNKLDHVFEPSHLSIVGLMTMNKFFLLNFAKIVITASVMTIQFISKR